MPNPNPNPSTRFPPGRSGNPGGNPVGTRSVTSRLRELLESRTIGGKPIRDGKQVADLVAEVIARQALNGDFRFVDLVLNRTEGKVPDVVKAEDAARPTPRLMPKFHDDRYPDDPEENPGGG